MSKFIILDQVQFKEVPYESVHAFMGQAYRTAPRYEMRVNQVAIIAKDVVQFWENNEDPERKHIVLSLKDRKDSICITNITMLELAAVLNSANEEWDHNA